MLAFLVMSLVGRGGSESRRTRHGKKHKVPRTSVVDDLQLLKVPIHDLAQEHRHVGLRPAVPDVVDPDPYPDERVVGGPRREGRVRRHGRLEHAHLVDQAQDGRLEGLHQLRVRGRTAGGEVVR